MYLQQNCSAHLIIFNHICIFLGRCAPKPLKKGVGGTRALAPMKIDGLPMTNGDINRDLPMKINDLPNLNMAIFHSVVSLPQKIACCV